MTLSPRERVPEGRVRVFDFDYETPEALDRGPRIERFLRQHPEFIQHEPA